MGNASSVSRIAKLAGRGGIEPGPHGLGFGARSNPGGLEGGNPAQVSLGARSLMAVIAGVALLALSRAAATGNVHTERVQRAPPLRAP